MKVKARIANGKKKLFSQAIIQTPIPPSKKLILINLIKSHTWETKIKPYHKRNSREKNHKIARLNG